MYKTLLIYTQKQYKIQLNYFTKNIGNNNNSPLSACIKIYTRPEVEHNRQLSLNKVSRIKNMLASYGI